jgi:hypothetical protein
MTTSTETRFNSGGDTRDILDFYCYYWQSTAVLVGHFGRNSLRRIVVITRFESDSSKAVCNMVFAIFLRVAANFTLFTVPHLVFFSF